MKPDRPYWLARLPGVRGLVNYLVERFDAHVEKRLAAHDLFAHERVETRIRAVQQGIAAVIEEERVARASDARDSAFTRRKLDNLQDIVHAQTDSAEAEANATRLAQVRLTRRENVGVPLVSILVPTYNRARLVTERAVRSALAQTHPRIEVIVVGDGCTDETGDALASLADPRVHFTNLPKRGDYPSNPELRWMVAGTSPVNHSLALARGEWIAHLDDDDEFSPDHVEALLAHACSTDAEFVWGKVLAEGADGQWRELGDGPLQYGKISRMSVMHRADLRFMNFNPDAWRRYEPGDWNLWRRMQAAGVRMEFLPKIVGRHYRERQAPP